MAMLKRSGRKLIDSYLIRFLILCSAAIVGCFIYKPTFSFLDGLFEFSGSIDKYLEPLLLALPVFVCLWLFRTYDTQQQIHQGNFVTGVNKLVQDSPMVIDVGVEILLQVSAKTDAFDDAIRLAFIKRLKERPQIPEIPSAEGSRGKEGMEELSLKFPMRLTYAQYILQWLIAKQANYPTKPDLAGMCCEYQKFKIAGLDLVKILPTPNEAPREPSSMWYPVSLVRADCETLNFDGVAFGIFITWSASNITKDGERFLTELKSHSKPSRD